MIHLVPSLRPGGWLVSLLGLLMLWVATSPLVSAGTQGSSPTQRPRSVTSGFTGPRLLTYEEMVELSQCGDKVRPELQDKMDKLLKTAFIKNGTKTQPHLPVDPQLGKCLRVVEWNIERGLNFEIIVAALRSRREFSQFIDQSQKQNSGKTLETALQQVQILKDADILILNELDYGLKRTNYRFVAQELAQALNMNFAYAVEFLEIDPVQLGTEEFEGLPEEERAKLRKEIEVDKERFRGLHGTAVLTRFPIRNATVTPLPVAYDWFHEEQKPVSLPEKAKRGTVSTVFLEKILREIRRGGRTTLQVELEVPVLPEKSLTVIAPHTENKCKPEGRRIQVESILERIKSISHPVILAGDLNTTLTDGQPTSIKREVTKRVGSKQFWATQGIKYATGIGLVWDVFTGGINFLKNQHDPTAKHIPVVAPNPEEKLFETLESFRFADGGCFDFRGDTSRTIDGRSGTLANSNQRDTKGFATTFEVERTVGPAGKFKLDWFFVKAYARHPRDSAESYRFAPHFARTLYEVNTVVQDRISDHCPITIDLPLAEPRLKN
ncbi:MAG: endonuclease/exonuclease/phosphatase family protein [Blastocatellia bacterium]|nr:endonuclease/exonuclease/phosphatase family protein [Blastocatellia bacterium]